MTQREKDIRKAAKLYKGDKSALNKMSVANLSLANSEFFIFALKLIFKYGPAILKDIIDYIKAHE